MQKNLKGLLCCLLHQALSHEPTVLDKVLTQISSYQSKDYDADWSPRDLESLFLDTLISYPFPICIFIDGLDEICSDDVLALLKLIDDARSLPSVKVCVASQPEALFWRRFGNHQQMCLQDLTKKGMWAYARSVLSPGRRENSGDEASSGPDLPSYMLSNMVSKAEGVFLWLHLATRSFLRGLQNGDDITELESRLETLPGGLSELYADIWSRLNADSAIYRKVAAEYLHLLLDARILDRVLASEGLVFGSRHWDGNLNLAQFTILTTRQIRGKVFDPSTQTQFLCEREKDIDTLCQETEASIQRRCAGLVEVRKRLPSHHPDARQPRNCVLTFIHQTAYDFLTDSEEGHKILSFYECREEERCLRLAQGLLPSSKFRLLSLDLMSIALPHVRSPDLKDRIFEALRTVWNVWDAGQYLLTHKFWRATIEQLFLSVVAARGLTDFILSVIS